MKVRDYSDDINSNFHDYSMDATLNVELESIELRLLGEGGVYWPERQILFIADAHLGKEATFRSRSVPTPSGSSAGTLRTISRMIHQTNARHLIILGDLFHARSSLASEVLRAFESFLAEHSGVPISLVLGNHDRRVGKLPAQWPVTIFEPGHQLGNLCLGHEPHDVPESASLLLCGHVHPAMQIGSRHDQLGRLRCFWWNERRLVLPAVGEFTGTFLVRPSINDRVWLIAQGEVVEFRATSPTTSPR